MTTMGKKALVNGLIKGCLAPEILTLKEGASVMFVKNNPAKGYINGTLGTVVGFDDEKFPVVKVASRREIVATPSSWVVEENEKVLAEISQVPLRLAWAITVHKSQGISLDAAEIDLSRSFDYGMGYVALSRLRSLSGLRLLGINNMAFRVNSEIGEMDLAFRKSSKEAVMELEQLSEREKRLRHNDFLKGVICEDSGVKSEDAISALFNRFFGKK
jgi:ATP-dependent exoDNAse (exonuclease V) alpha subunit